ncbi:hypothetical protein FOA43_004559 [Brettanomyces nanus]|uniref:Exocyst complex component Sec10 n=1 Tax=Eeniella nana TaxID=13502 RepID=A0A875SEU7_EENNA|nr:uncharacterized protein FOA43_004559 [Brettanomyces nanus]QPG77154.1 hypothetical protein FOA43_004559 [Brettanomyces nanus]
MSSLYQLDDDTKSLLTLDNFLKDLSVTEFVDRLAKQNVQYKSKFNNGVEYIDPKPYIRTFELVQKELNNLSRECVTKKTRLEQQAHAKSVKHYENVLHLNSKAAELNERYNKLTTGVSKLYGSDINPLGEKLTEANSLKEHSFELIFLTKCYNEFYTKGQPPEEILKYKPQDMERIAKVFNQLLSLSSKLSGDENGLPRTKKAHELIQQYADMFEKDQLENFNKYYKQKDIEKSQQIARVLFTFNGGANIVEGFFGNHPVFSKLFAEKQSSLDKDYWIGLGNPDETSYALDTDTNTLLTSISETFASELDSITEIFQTNSGTVLESLISKLFGQIINARVNYLVKMASSYSKLALVRVLHLAATETYRLSLSKMASALENRNLQLSGVLEKAYNDIFAPYLKNDSQFKIDKSNLEELLDSLITQLDGQVDKAVQKHILGDKISSFKYEHSSTHDSSNTASASNSAPEAPEADDETGSGLFKEKFIGAKRFIPHSKRFRRFTSISSFIKNSERNSTWRERLKRSAIGSGHLGFHSSSVSVIASSATASVSVKNENLPPLIVTEKILSYVVESLKRSIELVPSKINEYSMEIFEIMMFKIGPSYIFAEMEALYFNSVFLQGQKLNSFFSSPSYNLDLSFLQQLNVIFFQLYLLSIVVKKSFYPLLLTNSVKVHLVGIFNGFLQDMEIGLNITIADLIDLITANVKSILNGQNIEDFNPRAQNITIDKTETCDKLTQFMDYTLREVHANMSSNPSLEFEMVKRISNSFLEILIDHFRNFKVNSTGSLIVTQDAIHYISVFDNYDFEELKRKKDFAIRGVTTVIETAEDVSSIKANFLILKELTNLFSCQPELLKDLCNEGRLTYLKRNVLREYIRNRIDFQESFLDGI